MKPQQNSPKSDSNHDYSKYPCGILFNHEPLE